MCFVSEGILYSIHSPIGIKCLAVGWFFGVECHTLLWEMGVHWIPGRPFRVYIN